MALYSDFSILWGDTSSWAEDFQAVFQSLYNLLNTAFGSRLFRPLTGSKLKNYIAEPCDEITANSIKTDLKNLFSLEPRVQFQFSKSSVTPIPSKKAFNLYLVFSVVGFEGNDKTLNLTLTKTGKVQ